jgi:copper oxidase (laccase) domain-containing protein
MSGWLIPDWPAPAGVKACVTTRAGGVSLAPFDSLNLGDHVDDSPEAVVENRRRLTDHFSIQPAWLKQVYGHCRCQLDGNARYCLHGDDRGLPAGAIL